MTMADEKEVVEDGAKAAIGPSPEMTNLLKQRQHMMSLHDRVRRNLSTTSSSSGRLGISLSSSSRLGISLSSNDSGSLDNIELSLDEVALRETNHVPSIRDARKALAGAKSEAAMHDAIKRDETGVESARKPNNNQGPPELTPIKTQSSGETVLEFAKCKAAALEVVRSKVLVHDMSPAPTEVRGVPEGESKPKSHGRPELTPIKTKSTEEESLDEESDGEAYHAKEGRTPTPRTFFFEKYGISDPATNIDVVISSSKSATPKQSDVFLAASSSMEEESFGLENVSSSISSFGSMESNEEPDTFNNFFKQMFCATGDDTPRHDTLHSDGEAPFM